MAEPVGYQPYGRGHHPGDENAGGADGDDFLEHDLGAEKHENVLFAGTVPLMVCDVWEHAYYLTYQNRRAAYVDAFLKHLVDWGAVARRLAAAAD